MSVLLTRYRCGHERQKLIECERARTRHLSHPCPTVVRTFVEPYGCLQAEPPEKMHALAACFLIAICTAVLCIGGSGSGGRNSTTSVNGNFLVGMRCDI